VDERLIAYVRGQWTVLLDHAMALCGDADDAETRELVLATLTRVASRWRLVSDKDNPDAYVRKALERRCADRNKEWQRDSDGIVAMEIGFVDEPPDARGEAMVADAVVAAQADVAGDAAGDAADVVAVGEFDPIAVLDRRVHRARRRQAVFASAAALVVVAAAVGAVGSGGNSTHAARVAKSHQVSAITAAAAFPQPLSDFASGVTAGGGYIWTIENRSTKRGSRTYVVERSPISGRVEKRYRVPQPDDHIGYGFGKAWAWHDNNDASTTALATVDGGGDVDTQKSTPPIAVQDATFTSRLAWFTEPAVNAVVTYRTGLFGITTRLTIPGAKFVVPLSGSSVLVATGSGELRSLPGNEVVDRGERAPTLLAPAPDYGIWIAHGRQLSYQASIALKPSVNLTLPLNVAGVTGDPAHGVYVATSSDNPLHYDPYLVYYSPAALKAPHPQPTARLDGLVQAEDMVANPAGGVVFTTNEGDVDAWNAVALVGRASQGGDRTDHAGITSSTRQESPRGGFA
jgi:hypothetical protein